MPKEDQYGAPTLDRIARNLESLLNQQCMENGSDTPDFILADYLCKCLEAFDTATKRRDDWSR